MSSPKGFLDPLPFGTLAVQFLDRDHTVIELYLFYIALVLAPGCRF